MLERIAAAVFALALVLNTGIGPGLLHLCSMSGQVKSHCCCQKGGNADEGTQLERDMRCCELKVTESLRPAATVRDGQAPQAPELAVVALVPQAASLGVPATDDGLLPLGARAPPEHTGPPIFVRNCSFLI